MCKGGKRLRSLGGLLGLTFKEKEEPPVDVVPLKKLAASICEKSKAAGVSTGAVPDDVDSIMALLISIRKELRKVKQFQLADEIRNGLSEIGIALEDTPQGTVWKQKR